MAFEFPAFLRLEYRDDGNAKSQFIQDVDDLLARGEDRFREFSTEAKRQLDRALTVDRNAFGSLDLGAAEARAAAQATEARAVAARELAAATALAAKEEGDLSREARLAIAAMEAQAIEEEQAARAARSHAEALDQVQAVLDRNASATEMVIGTTRRGAVANDNAAASTKALRFGMMDLGRQLSDVTTMWALGARPMQIFASQSGQIIQSVQLMAGGTSKLASFLMGPWGLALSTGALALTPLIGKLFEAKDAAEETASALQKAMDALYSSLAQTSKLTDALTEATKERVTALGELARLNREIGSTERTISVVQRTPGTDPSAVSILTGRLANLQRERDAARVRANTAEANARDALATSTVTELQGRNRKRLNSGADRSETGTGSGRADRLSAEARSYRQASEAAEQYIVSLQDEIAKIGATPGQIRQMEVARAKDAAATDAQRAKIEELNAAREEALSKIAREEAATRNREALDRLGEQIAGLDQEYRLLGLVGPAREKAALALEEEGFKAKAAADGILDVEGAWQRYLAARSRNLDAETALDRDRQAVELLNRELDRTIGSLGSLGGVGGVLGDLLGLATGNIGAIRGSAGAILQTIIGTSVDEEGKVIARTIGDEMREVFGLSGEFGQTMQSALEGAGIGALASNALFGRQSTTGQIGSAVGGALGKEAGEALTKSLGGLLGSAGGPLGSILGGVAGGLLGGLFGGGSRTARAYLTGPGSLSLGGADSGNYGAAQGLGGSVLESLNRIAQALGADVGAFSVSIGTRGGDFRVNPTGTSLKKSKGARDFGQDEGAALAYALADALRDGAIRGLTAAEQRLIGAGKNAEAAIENILDFRSVFDRLRAIDDPLGAAIEALDKEFGRLRDIFAEAGASAAEYAELERLYGIERAKAVEETMDRLTGSLQDLYDDLTMGDMGLSLRDRKSAAQERYDGLADRLRAGDLTASDDFAEAARDLLGIQRQISGSQSAYFNLFDEARDLSKGALDEQQRLVDAAMNRDSPFGGGAGAALDNQGVIDGLEDIRVGIDAVNRNLGNIGGLLTPRAEPRMIPLRLGNGGGW